jgi:hypothetical protein
MQLSKLVLKIISGLAAPVLVTNSSLKFTVSYITQHHSEILSVLLAASLRRHGKIK